MMSWLNILEQSGFYAIYAIIGIIVVLIAVYMLRNVIWLIRYPFLLLNWIQWILYNPIRDYWRHPKLGTANLSFNLLFLTLLSPVWWLAMHIILTPVRIVNAIYFNIILYWSVSFCDSIAELLQPKREKYRRLSLNKYWWKWITGFPGRLLNVISRNGLSLLEGILMTGVDTVLPTYTMYHGTSFKGIATNIATYGRWYVGGGDYAGSGIYFGFYKKTAAHYATGDDHAIIVARVTLFPCRNSATLPYHLRKKIGNDGTGITHGIGFPWKAIEHWRDHSYAQWFEYCLLQPEKAGQYVRTWRARPICVLKKHLPSRIWGGLSLWTSGAGGVGVIVFSWLLIFVVTYLFITYRNVIP